MTVTASPCSKKNGPIMPLDQNPLPNSESFWVHRLFYVCVRVFCAPNATILLVYITAKIKMSFICKDDFFFAKIGIFCKSIAGPYSPAVVVVQAYTQPYSFGGRIKLIICQIRHELSVYHSLNNHLLKRKNLDGGPIIFGRYESNLCNLN